jgi:hypothetical protein
MLCKPFLVGTYISCLFAIISTTYATTSGIHLTKAKAALLRSQSVVRKFKPNAPSRIIIDGKLDNISSTLDYDLFSDARGEEEGIIVFEGSKTGGLKITSFTEPVMSIELKDPKVHAKDKIARKIVNLEGNHLHDWLDVTDSNHSTNEGAIGKHIEDRKHAYHQAAGSGELPYKDDDVYGDPVLANKITVTNKLTLPHGILQVVPSADISVGGVLQWKLAVSETFEKPVEGWYSVGNPPNKRNSCAKGLMERLNGDSFLGYYKNAYVKKTFHIPPDHSRLKVRANFHFFDMWSGQVAQMKINGALVWQKAHKTCDQFSLLPEVGEMCLRKGINSCGGDDPDTLGYVLEHTLSYFGSTVDIEFGATIPDTVTGSWGVDDVELYVA